MIWRIAGAACAFGLAAVLALGCGPTPFDPRPVEDVPFRERAVVQSEGGITVTAAVPSAAESRQLFAHHLYRRGIQPVWIQIENGRDEQVSFLPVGLDPEYYSPIETAYLNQSRDPREADEAINRYFFERGMGLVLAPGQTRAGFVFTPVDEGTKAFNVDIIGQRDGFHFTFFVPVPGLRIDHERIDWENVHAPDEIVDLDRAGLVEFLESLPCCTTDAAAKDSGDPLNIAVVGDPDDVYYAFVRAGWDETETIYGSSLVKTVRSFLTGGQYRYSPVSGLYVFGRPQDVAFQRARNNIHERNHLRLWMSPKRHEGKPVWVGQISRDIGVRFTRRTITTHKIDPDVDETREYLVENLAYSQSLAAFAYVGGVGPAPYEAPRGNLTGDPYFTDGRRVVLWVSSRPVAIDDVDLIDLDAPALAGR